MMSALQSRGEGVIEVQEFISIAFSPLCAQRPHVLFDVHTNAHVDVKIDVIERIVVFLQQNRSFRLAKGLPPLHKRVIELICRRELLAINSNIVIYMPHV